MSNYIYEDTNKKNNTELEEKLYTSQSHAEYIDNEGNPRTSKEDNALAQARKRPDGSYRYMIKLNAQLKPFNVLSIYGESAPSQFLETVCRQQHKYKTVNLNIFDLLQRYHLI